MKMVPRDEGQQDGFAILKDVLDLVTSPRLPPRISTLQQAENSPRELTSQEAGNELPSGCSSRTMMLTPSSSQSGLTQGSTYRIAHASGFTSSVNLSEPAICSGPSIAMVSPYRSEDCRSQSSGSEKDPKFAMVTFSKELLASMDHGKRHLELDLFQPEVDGLLPIQDLSPLCLYRHLRTLKIFGMMQSYQSYIWLVVWLNPELRELELEMANEGEGLDTKAIGEAQDYAVSKPTMSEVMRGKSTTMVFKKFPLVKLSLTNFVVERAPFSWFSGTRLQEVKLHRCKTTGFRLPDEMRAVVKVTVTE
ncbi:hypothetical protein MMC28_007316 [Mycoblastus sanguinarius]|nr:hypothetical protein [Mycoblastus sanguinarius]